MAAHERGPALPPHPGLRLGRRAKAAAGGGGGGALRYLLREPWGAMAEKMFMLMDVDVSNSITIDEFCHGMTSFLVKNNKI